MKGKIRTSIVLLVVLMGMGTSLTSAQVIFQRPFGVAIDDLGWNEGRSLGDEGGGWRAGVRRDFDVRDYKPIVEVGQEAGVRFMGLFVLGEMDRLNVVSQIPTITKAGYDFDNSSNIDASQIEVMEYVKNNAAYLEFGIHGVGHEHWIDGVRKRAEWYNLEDNEPWPEADSRAHIEVFKQIMSQYGMGEEAGHSFPESFVPCAYGYYWNPDGAYSTGKLMHDNGVKYVNTDFTHIQELNPPAQATGGFDHGVLVIDRLNYGNPWYELASLPSVPIDSFRTDIIETHWPNWLAQDDFLQEEVNQQWINFFKKVQEHPEFYLAKNTEQFNSQWLYKRYTEIEEKEPGVVHIDNRNMPSVAYENDLLGNLVLSVKLKEGEHVQKAEVNGKSIPAYFEESGYGFMYLPELRRDTFTLTYQLGDNKSGIFVENTGTYNVYDVEESNKQLLIDLKVYGTQTIKLHMPNADQKREINAKNKQLLVKDVSVNKQGQVLEITLEGKDIQGSRDWLIIK
ncbi:hypothetical protein [Gracilimonas mengyeensis]|uniref:Uncharacterized protein n=1 Tax=Gracilimonas mengyeensis TaxID=1302730 RepID=A0A521BT58_9BACT|nr:hypothetical protein [Gracilimonas mengyeensis]SMO50245.1 hypothetical protein SAMN06265219_10365 [Gracilimonas mengyeensis]